MSSFSSSIELHLGLKDPMITSHKNICDKCKSRYEGFSVYIERCKINTSKIDELLSMGQVKDEPSIDIVYHPCIKKEFSNEVGLNSYCPEVFIEQQMLADCSNSPMRSNDSTIDKVLLAGRIKKEPFTDIEDHVISEEDVWKKEEASDPDYPTASGVKGKDGLVLRVVLERQVLPDSMVHKKNVNNKPMCTYCGKTFKYPCKLKVHLRTHIGERPFKCPHCNKSFTRFSHLNVHLRIHTGDKPFTCSLCNKSFTHSNSLKSHLYMHSTDDKPFKCLHCNKSFTQSTGLKYHLRIHTGDKPFECSHCNKSFIHSAGLRSHLRIHTGDKPFECSHCNKSFTHSTGLKYHLRIHTGDKPFECSHCNKRFTHSGSLNAHLRIHAGNKPFKCSHCNKSFTHSNSLKSHLRLHTNDK